jgi:uncharacterized protein
LARKDKNTGAILIVVPNEHKVRIEVGYGLEGELHRRHQQHDHRTATSCPIFKRGDFNAGVLSGTTSILKVLGGASAVRTEPDVSSNAPSTAESADTRWNFPVLFAVFMVFLIFRSFRRRRYGVYRRVGRTSGYGGFPDDGFSRGGGGFSGGGGSFGGGGASGRW